MHDVRDTNRADNQEGAKHDLVVNWVAIYRAAAIKTAFKNNSSAMSSKPTNRDAVLTKTK